ncbi:hypothetical protein RRG08_059797 [Elysia crispata]|uniref:Uncharacterized protein n=1 Tax=Elysia crispata TaxID=231223 RepID=A0AAE1BCT0_9GAST|nr:hypothetical protein RRG08_059797 [Elysia crispata]
MPILFLAELFPGQNQTIRKDAIMQQAISWHSIKTGVTEQQAPNHIDYMHVSETRNQQHNLVEGSIEKRIKGHCVEEQKHRLARLTTVTAECVAGGEG